MLNILKELNESYKAFKEYGSRSPKKLKPIHSFIALDLQESTDSKYEVKSIGLGDSKEHKMEGIYNDKKVDIAILKENNLLGVINFKFVMGNIAQNRINLFEQASGEYFNMPEDVVYGNVLVIFGTTPYRNKDGKIIRYDKISNIFFKKYKKFKETKSLPTHKFQSIIIVEEDDGEIVLSDYRRYNLSIEYQNLLEKEWLYPNFLKAFSNSVQKKAKLYKRRQGIINF